MNTILTCSLTKTKLARKLARLAVRALYFEVKAYPKPGLVSFIDAGAHADMSGAHFYASLFTLRHYFYNLILADQEGNDFNQLKKIAIQAEERMLNVTKGINTHRGAIFALGLLCLSVNRLILVNPHFTPQDLQNRLLLDWKNTLFHHHGEDMSHGSIVKRTHAVEGAKEMAMQGYPVIFNGLLEQFLDLYYQSKSLDKAILFAYASIFVNIEDTNVLYRVGEAQYVEAKNKVSNLLLIKSHEDRYQQGLILHNFFSNNNISPGGVGDLISALIFVAQLYSEGLRCRI